MIEAFGPDIWTMDGDDVKMFGMLPFTTRMVIVRTRGGGLWLHSPVRPTPDRQAAVDQLGSVVHLVAPNKIHSLGIRPWKALYPLAKVWASPAFIDRHPDIAINATLSQGTKTPWGDDIDHCPIEGHRVLDEVVFLHKPSRTLIVTDVIQKHEIAKTTWIWRRVKAMVGVLGKDGGVPLDIKLTIRDRHAMRRSLEAVLRWDFDNLILAHGHCLQGGAKDAVARAFEWIMGR